MDVHLRAINFRGHKIKIYPRSNTDFFVRQIKYLQIFFPSIDIKFCERGQDNIDLCILLFLRSSDRPPYALNKTNEAFNDEI